MSSPSALRRASAGAPCEGATARTEKERDLVQPASRKDARVPSSFETNPAEYYVEQIKELHGENEFLKDNVQRLSVELARYQAKYPALDKQVAPAGEGLTLEDPLPGWLVNSQYMSPLLAAYDERMSELQKQAESALADLAAVKERTATLANENERLHGEIQQHIAALIRKGETEDPSPLGTLAGCTVEEWQEVQERIDILTEENDMLLEQQGLLKQELARVTDESQARLQENMAVNQDLQRHRDELGEFERVVSDLRSEKQRYMTDMQRHASEMEQLSRERESLRQEVRHAKEDLVRGGATLAALGSGAPGDVETHLQRREMAMRDSTTFRQRERELVAVSDDLDSQLSNLKDKYLRAIKDVDAKTSENQELLETVVALEKRLAEFQQKDIEAVQMQKATLDLVEEIKLERDQALMREQQAEREVARLSDKLKSIEGELRDRFEAETEGLRLERSSEVAAFAEQIRSLELEVAEATSQVDRLQRDKRSLEVQMEQLKTTTPVDHERQALLVEELHSTVRTLERERDRSQQMEQSAQNALKRLQIQLDKEKGHLLAQCDGYTRRIQALEQECDLLKGERSRMSSQLDQLRRSSLALVREKEAIERKAMQDVTNTRSSTDAQIRDLEKRLDEVHDAYDRSSRQLQEALAARDAMNAKWREESRRASRRYEGVIQELKNEASRAADRAQSLQIERNQLVAERDEQQTQVSDAQQILQQVRLQQETAERRIQEAASQMSSSLAREEALMSERKELHRQIDRLVLEKERAIREQDNLSRQLATCEKRLRELETSNIASVGQEVKAYQQAAFSLASDLRESQRRQRAAK